MISSKLAWAVTAALLAPLASGVAATRTWDGGGGDGSFGNVQNWDGNTTVPVATDDLQFGAESGGAGLFGLDSGTTVSAVSATFLPTAPGYILTSVSVDDALRLTRDSASGPALLNQSAQRQQFQLFILKVGAASQTWDSGAGGFQYASIQLGNNQTLNFTGTGISAANRTEIRNVLDGEGSSGIVKSGTGTLYFAPTSGTTYTGSTRISGGTVLLGGSNKLPDVSELIMDGGTFDLDGFDEKLGKLTLTADSTIDFGEGNASLLFGQSTDVWSGNFKLNIANFTPGQDTLRFDESAGGFNPANLVHIVFDGNTAAQIDENGFVSPVPEPSAALLIGMGALVAGGFRRRRAA